MAEEVFSNLFYFRRLCHIGGTEQFLYEIAKKYHKYDITVLYDYGDLDQVLRLKKLVRCIQRDPNKTYHAKKAFYNFNLEALDQIEADEHIFICHAIYQKLPLVPPLTYPKLTGYMGVSQYSCEELKKYAESQGRQIEPVKCYNPLTLEKPNKVVRIISACRLDDKVKGGERTIKLIQALDKISEQTGRHYLWHIFTNNTQYKIDSPNVIYMPARPDIRDYIADADWVVQLSDDMESYGYTINEALGYGTGLVRTPLSIAKELNIPKEAELVCDWNMANAEEIAKKMFEPRKNFVYKPPKDGWESVLVHEPSDYTPKADTVLVKPVVVYTDLERGEQMNKYSEPFEVTIERARKLVKLGFVVIVG